MVQVFSLVSDGAALQPSDLGTSVCKKLMSPLAIGRRWCLRPGEGDAVHRVSPSSWATSLDITSNRALTTLESVDPVGAVSMNLGPPGGLSMSESVR